VVENQDIPLKHFFPNQDRMSVLTGIITLAYILSRFLNIPTRTLAVQLPGIYLSISIDINTLVGFFVAGLTAAGADWIYREHPALKGSALPYWILPALTALVIGFPLHQLPFGVGWWIGLLMGVMLLALVLTGEYVSIDSNDIRHPLAAAGLSAVSFALFLVLVVSMRSEDIRLFLTLPGLAFGAWLVSLRVLHLRLQGQWLIYEGALIGMIVSQIAAALYYWPVTPVAFGVLVTGPAYALNSLFIGLIEERPLRRILVEPAIAILISMGAAAWAMK
jgi:hypothetical protein